MAAIEWFGPLIDLSDAASHIGDYVQLLVLVRAFSSHEARRKSCIYCIRCLITKCAVHPLKNAKQQQSISTDKESKCLKNRSAVRTQVQVGDNTSPQFIISSWDKQIVHKLRVGDIILMQNVRITVFRGLPEAVTLQCSSYLCLVHSTELTSLRDADGIVAPLRIGTTAKDKLKLVISWALRTKMHDLRVSHIPQPIVDATKNWKINGQQELRNCRFISEVICIEQSCRARFDGYIREIYLERPDGNWYHVDKKHFTCVNDVIDNLICRGCNYCGIPIESCLSQKKPSLFYCEKSHNHFHEVCWIYRPFQLCVSDDNGDVSLLVKNAAAEILFGNVTAELVKQSLFQLPKLHLENQKASLSGLQNEGQSADGDESSPRVTCIEKKRINFFKIWLIFLRLLLEYELNSPFRFEVDVSYEEESECPAFELVSFRMPFGKT